MRLADLNPYLAGGVLRFDCPHCRNTQMVVPLTGDGAWTMTGEFPDSVTLTPSVDTSKHGHWHGLVTNGEVR